MLSAPGARIGSTWVRAARGAPYVAVLSQFNHIIMILDVSLDNHEDMIEL